MSPGVFDSRCNIWRPVSQCQKQLKLMIFLFLVYGFFFFFASSFFVTGAQHNSICGECSGEGVRKKRLAVESSSGRRERERVNKTGGKKKKGG